MVLIKKLSHVSIFTNDFDKVYKFYIDILELKIAHKFINENNEIYGLFLSVGNGTFLEFFKKKSDIKNNFINHFCFEVKDIYKTKKKLEKHMNINIVRGKSDKILQFKIKDYENNIIEFHQYDKMTKLKFINE